MLLPKHEAMEFGIRGGQGGEREAEFPGTQQHGVMPTKPAECKLNCGTHSCGSEPLVDLRMTVNNLARSLPLLHAAFVSSPPFIS